MKKIRYKGKIYMQVISEENDGCKGCDLSISKGCEKISECILTCSECGCYINDTILKEVENEANI